MECVLILIANYDKEGNTITSVAFDDTLVEVYTKKIKSKYGSIFTSLGIEVGFAQFLRVLMAYEATNPITSEELRQILPNTSTNQSLRVFLQNLETKA